MTKTGRISIFAALLALVIGLVVFTVMAFLRTSPPTVSFTSTQAPGQPVHLTVETVGAIGFGAHPTWVSYLVENPQGQWVHSTIWQLPADSKIDVTLYQFDSGSPLRNQQFGLVTGTKGGVYLLNGKTVVHYINSNIFAVGHTFTVPSLNINVPLIGVPGTPSNFCTSGPCNPKTQAHNTIQFSFHTPKQSGSYRFQCFIPCGLSFLYGNGGPMSTMGYMGGFLEVQ